MTYELSCLKLRLSVANEAETICLLILAQQGTHSMLLPRVRHQLERSGDIRGVRLGLPL